METIVGSIILKENKILMVKESKKACYGKWAFPAGHLEKNETIAEGAKRETLEETGCKVELEKVFPVFIINTEDVNVVMIHFLANLIEEDAEYKTDEILERKWISIEEMKSMEKNEFRSYAVVKNILESIEKNEFYKADIIKEI